MSAPRDRRISKVSDEQHGAPFPQWLKDELAKPGRSQSGLARHLGLDPSAINRLVNGTRELKYREMERISDYLWNTGGVDESGKLALPVRAIADIEIQNKRDDDLIDRHYSRLRLIVQMGGLLSEALDQAITHGVKSGEWTFRRLAASSPRFENHDQTMVAWAQTLGKLTDLDAVFLLVALDMRDEAVRILESQPLIASSTEAGKLNWAPPPEPFPTGSLRARVVNCLDQWGWREPFFESEKGRLFDITFAAICSLMALRLRTSDLSAAKDDIAKLCEIAIGPKAD